MAHKTLVNGTAYEIGGGKTLVGGTAYKIDKGKTLVGGTGYEIKFGEFVLVCDVGTNSPGTSVSGEPLASIDMDERGYTNYPDGYDKCNTIIVDGVEYELTKRDNSMPSYQSVDSNCPVNYFVFYKVDVFGVFALELQIYQRDFSAHNIQIGYYA